MVRARQAVFSSFEPSTVFFRILYNYTHSVKTHLNITSYQTHTRSREIRQIKCQNILLLIRVAPPPTALSLVWFWWLSGAGLMKLKEDLSLILCVYLYQYLDACDPLEWQQHEGSKW